MELGEPPGGVPSAFLQRQGQFQGKWPEEISEKIGQAKGWREEMETQVEEIACAKGQRQERV